MEETRNMVSKIFDDIEGNCLISAKLRNGKNIKMFKVSEGYMIQDLKKGEKLLKDSRLNPNDYECLGEDTYFIKDILSMGSVVAKLSSQIISTECMSQ